jgi:hypothetical protein
MKAKLSVSIIVFLILSVACYYTLELKRKFEVLQKHRLETIAQNVKISANAEVTEGKLRDETAIVAVLDPKKIELIESLNSLKSSGTTLTREKAEVEALIVSQEKELPELSQLLDKLTGVIEKTVVDNEQIKTLSGKIDELETLISASENLLAKNRAELDRLTKREMEYIVRVNRNAMESVVSAVDHEWGFIVIGAGTNTGFTPQTSLIIQRDGKMVARANPSSIEATQTIAEIDRKSMAAGTRVQPGDRVILARTSAN